MRTIYRISLFFIFFYYIFAYLFKKKYRSSFARLMGFKFPKVEKKGPLIWVHAVSMGETRAAIPLLKKLKAHRSHPTILLSTHTESGFLEGERSFPNADYHVYMPFDLVVGSIVKKVRPDLVVLLEGDLWLNFLEASKSEGARIVVVNGKISEKSYCRLKKFPSFGKLLFSPIDFFCLQDEIYKERFLKLGISENKISVTGNLKLDGFREQRPREELRKELRISEDDFVFTLGSTHDPEERLFLSTLHPLWEKYPNLKLIVVPRHPERFDKVEKILIEEKISYQRWSEAKPFSSRVLLVDAMGYLLQFYALSDLAFVGGSFTQKVGGHNIIEPAFYGVPVIFGPYMQSQPGFSELVLNAKAGLQLSQENLQKTLEDLLNNPDYRQQMGKNGKILVLNAKGALKKTEEILDNFTRPQHNSRNDKM